MDKIFIKDFSVAGKHGVMAHERSVEQEFIVDIEASYDAGDVAYADNIADTLDYVRMRDVARDVIEGEPAYLIEYLAERIAEQILEDARVSRVSVTIRKPAVFPSGTPGVTIERTHAA